MTYRSYPTATLKPSLQVRAQAELELRRRRPIRAQSTEETRSRLEADYRRWLCTLLPRHFRGEDQFAPHQEQFWEWGWSIEPDKKPLPPAYLVIWPRGGNKSTSAEALAVACGAKGVRKFVLYISRTQPQADLHIAAIQSMLVHSDIGTVYPGMADARTEDVAGRVRQAPWNRKVLSTANGWTIQGYGLQSSFRGVRVEDYRPDLIIISDIDDVKDRPQFVEGLRASLAGSALGTAGEHCAIVFEQNLIHHNSLMNRILTRETDVLSDRIEGGPVPALYGYECERQGDRWALSGEPAWIGQDLTACEAKINAEGREYFERECQHDVDRVLGRPRFDHEAIAEYTTITPATGELALKTNEQAEEQIKFYASPTGAVSIWQRPVKGRFYAAGVDTAEGKDINAQVSSASDPDYCVCIIREVESGDLVAMLRGQMTEGAFGDALYALLRWYNSPFVAPEVKGGYGRVTLNKLIEKGYETSKIFNKHMLQEIAGQPKYRGQVTYHDLGWDTNAPNRPMLIDFLDDAILKHEGETYSAVVINEYKHFCYGPTKPEAEPGYHDDCVIADCLCRVAIWFARRHRPRKAGAQPTRYAATGQPVAYEQSETQRAAEERARVESYKARM